MFSGSSCWVGLQSAVLFPLRFFVLPERPMSVAVKSVGFETWAFSLSGSGARVIETTIDVPYLF